MRNLGSLTKMTPAVLLVASVCGAGTILWNQRPPIFRNQIGASTSVNTLTLDGIGGTGLTNNASEYTGTATIAYSGGGCSAEQTRTVNLSEGLVVSITHLASDSGCTSLPSTVISGTETGATASPELVAETVIALNNDVLGPGVATLFITTVGSGRSLTLPGSPQTFATELINVTPIWCDVPTSWGSGGQTNIDIAHLNTAVHSNMYFGSILGNSCLLSALGTCAASQAFFVRAASNIAAAPTTYIPSITTWESAVDSLICGQVAAGTWVSKDIEYFLVAPSETLAEMNLVSSSYTLSPNGAIVFDPNVGVTGDGSTAYFDTGYDPSTGQMTSSSGYLGICMISNTWAGDGIGEKSATSGMYVSPGGSGSTFALYTMQGLASSHVNGLGTQGGFVVSRTDSAHIQSYFNGLPVGTSPFPSTGGIVGGTTLYVLGDNVSGSTPLFSRGTLGFAAAGAGETAAQILADHILFSAALATMLIQSGC